VQLRPITPDDLAACVEIFYEAEDELYGRLNQPQLPRNPQALERLFAHIVATDPGKCWLAEEGRRADGFGLAVERDGLHFLAFLFVRPAVQSRGLGRRLLEHCLPLSGRRATCVEAIQPVSTALYARYGLAPRLPIFTLVGQLDQPLAGLPAGLRLQTLEGLGETDRAALLVELDDLDRHVLGIGRPAEHRAWISWGREGFVLRADDPAEGPLGYGYAHSSGRLGPLLTLDETHLLPLLGELTQRVTPLDAWQVLVPGAAQSMLVTLLQAGFRLDGPPALFCADGPGLDHRRYLPATFALP